MTTILFASIALAFTLPMPEGRIASLRQYEALKDGEVTRQVLVVKQSLPGASVVQIEVNSPLQYQFVPTVVNGEQKIVQHSAPIFRTKVLSIPDSAPLDGATRERILKSNYFVSIRDLDAAAIVRHLFKDSLPSGVTKVPHSFAWDSHNPQGTWAHALRLALRRGDNSHLRDKAPRDVADFCPRFSGLTVQQKEIFWIALVNQVARFESSFVPLTASDEGRYNPGSKGVISSGLTQISIASTRNACYQARGCNVIRNQNDLFNPGRELQCTIAIMSCLAERADCISCKSGDKWVGVAAYWSTLRTPYTLPCPTCNGGSVTVGKKLQIQEAMKSAASFCFY